MRRKKQKKTEDLPVYQATELKDLVALPELKSFTDEELTKAMLMASDIEGWAIGMTQNYQDNAALVDIGMRAAWHARVFREVVAIQMFDRAQKAKGEPGTGQYL